MDMSVLRKQYMKLTIWELKELAIYEEIALPKKFVKSQLVDLLLQKKLAAMHPAPADAEENIPRMSVRVQRIYDAKKENREI